MPDFYVYAHYDASGRARYVGKGSGNRAWKMHARNRFWKQAFPDRKPTQVVLLATGLDETAAYQQEQNWIAQLQKEGHPLANLPPAKYWQGKARPRELMRKMTLASHTPEVNAKRGALLRCVALSEDHKAKISASVSGKNHPNWGKKYSPEMRAKLSEAHKGLGIGRRNSEATKEKMRLAALAREARKRGET